MHTGFLRPYGRGGRFASRDSSKIELLYPRDANATTANTLGLAAWTWSAYFQIVASTSADFYPHAVHSRIIAIPQSAGTKKFIYEVELATGAAGSEVTFARYSDGMIGRIDSVGANDALIAGRSYPIGSTLIPSGTRIAVRIRCQLADTAVLIPNGGLAVYLAGYDGTPPASDATYPLDEHLGGANTPHLLATPTGSVLTLSSGAFPSYGSWVEVIASAAADQLVWRLQGHGPDSGVANGSRAIQFGVGAAGSEVAYAQLGFPGTGSFAAGQYTLRRPLLVRAGERLAVRASGTAVNSSVQVLYEEL